MKNIILIILTLSTIVAHSMPIKVRVKLVSSPVNQKLPENFKKLSGFKNINVLTAPSLALADDKPVKVEIIQEAKSLLKVDRVKLGISYTVSAKETDGVIAYQVKMKTSNITDMNDDPAIHLVNTKTYFISGKVKDGESIWIPLGAIHFNKPSKNEDSSIQFRYADGGRSKLVVTFN